MLILRPNLRPAKKTMMLVMMMLMLRRNLRPAKKATMLRPLHTPVNVITLPLILGKKIPARITNCKSLPFFYFLTFQKADCSIFALMSIIHTARVPPLTSTALY